MKKPWILEENLGEVVTAVEEKPWVPEENVGEIVTSR